MRSPADCLREELEACSARGEIHFREPASEGEIADALRECGPMPAELASLYRVTNGIAIGNSSVLPIYSGRHVKRTWSSLQRLNSDRSPYLPSDPSFRTRFLLFALIGGPDFAAFDRADGSIWFSEGGELLQTDLRLFGFIHTLLKEEAAPVGGRSPNPSLQRTPPG